MGSENGGERPDDLEGVAEAFRRRWHDADAEMLEHMRRIGELRRLIVNRRTKAGRPLTKAGTDRLLRELEAHAIRATYLAGEAQKFCGKAEDAAREKRSRRVLEVAA